MLIYILYPLTYPKPYSLIFNVIFFLSQAPLSELLTSSSDNPLAIGDIRRMRVSAISDNYRMWLSAIGNSAFNMIILRYKIIGIDLDTHGKKLFGMYKTFHSNKDARGLGLFITKTQVEAMGGKIVVDSKPNEGSTFKIYFNTA